MMKRLMVLLRKILAAFDDWIFPPHAVCIGCGYVGGIEHDWLCDKCLSRIRSRVHCVHAPQWPENGISQAWFAMYYERPMSKVIRAFKYDQVYHCAPFIVSLM